MRWFTVFLSQGSLSPTQSSRLFLLVFHQANVMENFFEREMKRLAFVEERKKIRSNEKKEQDAESARRQQVSTSLTPSLTKALFIWEKVAPCTRVTLLPESPWARQLFMRFFINWSERLHDKSQLASGSRVTREAGSLGWRDRVTLGAGPTFPPRKHTLTRVGGPTRNTEHTGYVLLNKTTWRTIRRSQQDEWKADGLTLFWDSSQSPKREPSFDSITRGKFSM